MSEIERESWSLSSSNMEYDTDSDSQNETQAIQLMNSSDTCLLSTVLNKVLLIAPLAITIFIRAVLSPEFRVNALSWLLILPLTTDITLEEGVFPAFITSSLGYDNRIVELNMFMAAARSRLGLVTLFLISFYNDSPLFIICGILQLTFLNVGLTLLENSIPIPELSLICCALVNSILYIFTSKELNWYDPALVIACGLGAAVPCYPFFCQFVKIYKRSRGEDHKRQWKWALAVYLVYFSVGGVLYFGLLLPSTSDLISNIFANKNFLLFWGAVLLVAFVLAFFLGEFIGLDGRRKIWHLTSLCMFLPSTVRTSPFTKLSLSIALVLFLCLEAIRTTALPPVGIKIHNSLQRFVDHRDQRGPVIISHIYLLMGISMPIFLKSSSAGLICLGLGDTCASQIGRRLGRFRLFGQKSIEGCLAFALVSAIALKETPYALVISLLTALLEAVTPYNDNIMVPMYMLALQGLVTH